MNTDDHKIAKYEEQIPKRKAFSIGEVFQYIAACASIIGLICLLFVPNQEFVTRVYSIFLLLVLIFLLVHSYLKEQRKLHRYSQAIFYLHYVNHIVRDSLAETANNLECQNQNQLLQKTVNAVANCFGLLTGKRVRCTIKDFKNIGTIKTLIRDDVTTSQTDTTQILDGKEHQLSENSDFENLWYSTDGCSRYFLSGNLLKRWKTLNYKNSSLHEFSRKPKIKSFFGISFVKGWPLPYKSTLVVPIRYISKFEPPSMPGKEDVQIPQKSESPHWNYWGFLCIDCNSRNIFDREFGPELLAAFADVLYIYLSTTKIIVDNMSLSE